MFRVPELPQQKKLKSIAVLTSGGDAPGMNAAVRSVVRWSFQHQIQVHGVSRGYTGLVQDQIEELTPRSVANIIKRGGTEIKTSRCQEFHDPDFRKQAAENLRQRGIEGLIVIGGDGSFTGAHLLHQETGFPVYGVPGTIDNDIAGTDATIGFDTAVNTALQAIDKIRDTANSHDRLFVVEVMGRSSGQIALHVGLAGGAETILVPEDEHDLKSVCAKIEAGVKKGKLTSIIVVAEGNKSGGGHALTEALKSQGHPARACILGHVQRGGDPSAFDRNLASAMGALAAAFLVSGRSSEMIGLQEGVLQSIPFEQVIGQTPALSRELLHLTEDLAI